MGLSVCSWIGEKITVPNRSFWTSGFLNRSLSWYRAERATPIQIQWQSPHKLMKIKVSRLRDNARVDLEVQEVGDKYQLIGADTDHPITITDFFFSFPLFSQVIHSLTQLVVRQGNQMDPLSLSPWLHIWKLMNFCNTQWLAKYERKKTLILCGLYALHMPGRHFCVALQAYQFSNCPFYGFFICANFQHRCFNRLQMVLSFKAISR